MSAELLAKLKKNVIQGRKTREDIGLDDSLNGTPGVVDLVEEALAADIPVEELIAEGLTAGMGVVGEKFSCREYFIPDMLASADAVGAAMEVLRPHLEAANVETRGKVVIATVKGDIHDIGKNIVGIMLKGAGYEVHDVGIDVPEDVIVEAVRNEAPDYLGLSALLTTTMTEMSVVIKALEDAGLREGLKIIIGGAAVSDEYAREIGADAFGANAFQAVHLMDEMDKVKS
jgi:5-methyltetrahydrofolate--homocysteine methyltransferase